MLHSLLRLSVLAILVTVGAAVAAGFLVQHLMAAQARSAQRAQDEAVLRAGAQVLGAYVTEHRLMLGDLARQPALIDALQPERQQERARKLADLAPLFGRDTQTFLVPADIDRYAPAALGNRCAAVLRRIAGAEIPFTIDHHGSGNATHFDFVHAVRATTDGVLAGFIVVRVLPTRLQNLLDPLAGDKRQLFVQTVDTAGETKVIASTGTAAAVTGAATLVPLEQTPWEIGLKTEPASAGAWTAGHAPALALLIVLAIGALATLLFVFYRLNQAARHDITSLVRMFQDIREGSVRVDYPMELAEFNRVFSYLQESGKKLVQQQQKFKDMGLIDHLSQVHNRRAFEERLAELFKQSTVRASSAVLMIDIDHFKAVNDQLGHDAGDALIINIAQALKKLVRHSDFLARLGGDEFCVIFAYTPLRQAELLAERLRQELPRTVPLTKDHVHTLRWTGGISAMSPKDTKFDQVLWRADQALLRAKEAGRNQTQVYDTESGLRLPSR